MGVCLCVVGKSNVRTVQPFTKNDLSQIPFVEILRNFQILVDENVPENPLKFLYPNIPKDDALWKYYAENDAGMEDDYFAVQRGVDASSHCATAAPAGQVEISQTEPSRVL